MNIRIHAYVDLGGRRFENFFVNCDSVKNENSRVITVRMCIMNVIFKLYVKYYIFKIFSFQYDSGKQLVNHSHPEIYLLELLCFDVQTHSYTSIKPTGI
jgi:hypothetical protein